MDERTIRALEYPKIIELLAARATSALGADLAASLEPSPDVEEVRRRQEETSEARELLRRQPAIPLGGIRDLRRSLDRAGKGAILEPAEFLDIAGTVAAGRQLKGFILEQRLELPILTGLAAEILSLRDLEDAIRSAITDAAEVADGASDDLARIRRQIRLIQGRIRDRLESIIRSPEHLKYLQEPIITIREGRYVVPVRQEYRGQIPGIVHDQSASGATLFIEPLPVVEMNNDLRQLEFREREEIERILGALTARVRSHAGELQGNLNALGRLDFAFAKARLAEDMNATGPELNERGLINIRRGRHPLLRGNVVPVDVPLGREFDTLVLTGPNTGGKTVTLKTVGLLVLMAQAGLHLPAAERTEVAVFRQVFADIGDEQSIEQSLSTFSAHMTNIVRIVGAVDERTLVLLDEIGAGTDPLEGAALAMALLEFLQERGARTVATTHYSELKTFAYTRPQVQNAAVEFDVETLRPTYNLVIGLPGRSNAFEISRRLGLPERIIDQARLHLTHEDLKVETLIARMEENRIALERERSAAEAAHREAQRLKEAHARKLAELAAREAEILDRARAQAGQVLARARQEAEAAIAELKEARRRLEAREGLDMIQAARARLRQAREEAGAVGSALPEAEGEALRGVQPGQRVYVRSLRQEGTALTAPGPDGQVQVQVGIMKVQARLDDLRGVVERPPARGERDPEGLGRMMAAKVQAVSPEVDLRGLTVEEATATVDKYLDDAVLAGLKQVRLIHGKGTGALRRALGEWLRGDPRVRGRRPGAHGEGGEGVTVVTLDE